MIALRFMGFSGFKNTSPSHSALCTVEVNRYKEIIKLDTSRQITKIAKRLKYDCNIRRM